MTLYRLAVKGFDSDSINGSRSGHVIAAFPLGQDFGTKGECDFFGLVVDLPDDHPLVRNLGGNVQAKDGYKHRYRIEWQKAGISGETLAKIKDRGTRSPQRPDKISRPDVLVDRDV